MMEATLFWIGCGLGAYAFILRKIFSREPLIKRPALSAGLHLFFWTAVGALAGFVVSASIEIQGPTPRYPLIGAVIGFLWAAIRIGRSNSKKDAKGLLAGDLEWAETSYSAILLAAAIMYVVVQAFKIPSSSMESTLLIGDHLFVNKFIYGIRVPFTDHRILKWRGVRRQEIIVFDAPPDALSPNERERQVHKDFIKRAIALPGDVIEIRNKQAYVNGQLQNEPYAIYRDSDIEPKEIRDNFGPIRVPPNSYFVMGDNRDGSFDSRFWGPLPNSKLKGKAWLVYWPLRRVKIIR